MKNLLGANWKTTITTIGTVIFATITFFSQISYDQGPIALIVPAKYKPIVTWIAGACTAFLWIWNGISQKSKEVTGGTVVQTTTGDIAPEAAQNRSVLIDATKQATPPPKP
jgi:hypothetical protein